MGSWWVQVAVGAAALILVFLLGWFGGRRWPRSLGAPCQVEREVRHTSFTPARAPVHPAGAADATKVAGAVPSVRREELAAMTRRFAAQDQEARAILAETTAVFRPTVEPAVDEAQAKDAAAESAADELDGDDQSGGDDDGPEDPRPPSGTATYRHDWPATPPNPQAAAWRRGVLPRDWMLAGLPAGVSAPVVLQRSPRPGLAHRVVLHAVGRRR